MKDYSNYYPSIKDRFLNDSEILFNIQLESEGIEVKIQDNLKKVIIRNHGNPTNEFKEERYLISGKTIEIKQGDLVDYLEKIYMIITNVDKDNPTYNTCKMLKTNNHISILTDNNKIIKIPCIKSANTSNSDGISENKVITLSDDVIKVIVQKNEITNAFKKNMYFIFDHKNKYTLTRIYTNEDSGIIELTLKETEINPSVDNLELNIANYKTIKHKYEIITQENINVKMGEKYKLSYVLKDNGIEVVDKTILDKIVILNENLDTISVDIQGFITPLKIGNATLKLSMDIENEKIETVIQISVTDSIINNCNIDILSKDNLFTVDYLADKTFSAKYFVNGVENNNTKFTFSIKNKDIKLKEPLATIKSFTDNSCIISANNKAKYGTIILTVSLSDGSLSVSKEILIKNPFS